MICFIRHCALFGVMWGLEQVPGTFGDGKCRTGRVCQGAAVLTAMCDSVSFPFSVLTNSTVKSRWISGVTSLSPNNSLLTGISYRFWVI
jgi:hypothetical protein